jgi:hypothetical protein
MMDRRIAALGLSLLVAAAPLAPAGDRVVRFAPDRTQDPLAHHCTVDPHWCARLSRNEGTMRRPKLFTTLILAALPAALPAQYEAPANPPDPAVQLAEMVALYDEICLRAFPDDDAAARAVARYRAVPLSEAEIRRFLHDDPGIGWQISGRTGRFDLTIEQAPPYHGCGVRTMTAAGFADIRPYQALAARFERGGGFERITPIDRVVGELRIVGGGERHIDPDGSSESLLIAITTPTGDHRAQGMTAIEVRFAHQYYRPTAPRPPAS